MDTKDMRFLNTHISNLNMDEVKEFIDERVNSRIPAHIVSLKVDQVVKIEKNKEFAKIVKDAELVITDGTPLIWISKIRKTPIHTKIDGPRLGEESIKHAAKRGYSVFLLGAKDGVAVKAAKELVRKYKELKIAGTYSPPFGFEKNEEEIEHINNLLRESKADILIVGLSAPKQEIFVYNNMINYQIPISISLGAAIDFYAGNIKRAPEWVNKCGLEWLYRFFKEPKRLFRRYFVDDIKIFKIVRKYKAD